MPLRVPPGRAGRPWLVRRLGVARRGAEVLDEKRQALRREQERFARMVEETRAAWEETAGAAEVWLGRALVIGGRRRLDLGRFYVSEPAEVRLSWRSSLGTVYPAEAEVSLPVSPDVVAPGGSSALSYAAAAHGRAVEAGAHYAATRLALERVSAELRATTRRLRAIERRWIPEHEQALAALELALDETEREEAVRTRWVSERRGGRSR